MNKCLVTKLQASCSAMENPQYFGKAEILLNVGEVGDQPALGFVYLGGKPITFELVEGNPENWSIHAENVHSWITRSGNKYVINNPNTGQVMDSNAPGDNYTPIKFKTPGVYRIRFDKYYCAPYCIGNANLSLLKVEDIKYYSNGVYQELPLYSNNCFEGSLSELVSLMSPNAEYIGLQLYPNSMGVNGDISDLLKLEKLKGISLNVNRLISGDINQLDNHKNKANITLIRLSNIPLLTGNIVTAFSNYISLQSLYIENNSNITGSIEALAQAQYNNGRVSGSLIIQGYAPSLDPNPQTRGVTVSFTSDGYTIS